ncbi:MAG: dihydrofolate reductase [Candidatus Izemoplasmatales bacterium]|jgi:dihydrofolate reductase
MISLIFAIDPHQLLGKGNDLPWHYPEDLQYFKKTTRGKTVLMGLETFQSIISRNGKPLPNRHSVVASLSPFTYEGVDVINDLHAYLKTPRDEEIFVIGGKTIYELSLPFANRLYVTHIEKVYEGDIYFTKLDLSQFHLIRETLGQGLRFAIYERKS